MSDDPRDKLVQAYEQKFGNPPPRTALAILRDATPEEVINSFGAEAVTKKLGSGLAKRMRDVYYEAFKRVHGQAPTNEELEAVMAVGRHETIFGTAKFRGGVGPGMHNHGAVQCCKPKDGKCPANAFLSQDTTPKAGGGDTVYAVCFKKYANDVEGAADLIRIVGKRPLQMLKASAGSIAAFATGMYLQGYFESTNASASAQAKYGPVIKGIQVLGVDERRGVPADVRAGRVLMYAIGLDRNAATNAKEMGSGRFTQMTINSKLGVGLVGIFLYMAVAFGLYKLTMTKPKRLS